MTSMRTHLFGQVHEMSAKSLLLARGGQASFHPTASVMPKPKPFRPLGLSWGVCILLAAWAEDRGF